MELKYGLCGKGHRKPAVEALAVFRTHLERLGNKVPALAVADTKKITQGHLDARDLFAVPIGTQSEASKQRVPGSYITLFCNGAPYMGYAAGAGDIGKAKQLSSMN